MLEWRGAAKARESFFLFPRVPHLLDPPSPEKEEEKEERGKGKSENAEKKKKKEEVRGGKSQGGKRGPRENELLVKEG